MLAGHFCLLVRVLWTARLLAEYARPHPVENICCKKNPRLQLQGADTSDGAVFSVQHLFCFFEGTLFWSRTPSPLNASL